MAMAGIDLHTLRELAGHASIQMTMRYVHPTPEHKRQSMARFETFARSQAHEGGCLITLSRRLREYPFLPGAHN